MTTLNSNLTFSSASAHPNSASAYDQANTLAKRHYAARILHALQEHGCYGFVNSDCSVSWEEPHTDHGIVVSRLVTARSIQDVVDHFASQH